MRYPRSINNLINSLSELPSVGPKTAERYVFYLLQNKSNSLDRLMNALKDLQKKIKTCQNCGVITEEDPCPICTDKKRQQDILCIVESSQDLMTIESTKQYSGRYFVLGGLIDTINSVKPSDLNIQKLVKYIKKNKIKEIILALNFTLEGETTSLYLTKLLKDHLKITRLAKGLPSGSNLEYIDDLTLSSALKNRQEL